MNMQASSSPTPSSPAISRSLSEALRLAADQAERIEQQQEALALAAIGLAAIEYANAVEAYEKAEVQYCVSLDEWRSKHRVQHLHEDDPSRKQMEDEVGASPVGLAYDLARVRERNARDGLFGAIRRAKS